MALPNIEVVFYRESDGSVPLLDWLRTLSPKVRDKCLARLARLEQMGHELRRPEADYLRDGIYELRVSHRSLQYRMLYFFSGRQVVVVSHGLIKKRLCRGVKLIWPPDERKPSETNPMCMAFAQKPEIQMKRKKPTKRRFQSPALHHAYEQFIGDDPARIESFEQELLNAELARKLYDLRVQAGMSQRELAREVGTTASVICRLEDANYEGHSLAMLKRIAAALGKRVEIRFVASKRSLHRAGRSRAS